MTGALPSIETVMRADAEGWGEGATEPVVGVDEKDPVEAGVGDPPTDGWQAATSPAIAATNEAFRVRTLHWDPADGRCDSGRGSAIRCFRIRRRPSPRSR